MPKILIIAQNTRFSNASHALCFTFGRTYFEILNDPCHEISCSDNQHRNEHTCKIQCNSNVSTKCRLVTSSVPLCLQIMNSNNQTGSGLGSKADLERDGEEKISLYIRNQIPVRHLTKLPRKYGTPYVYCEGHMVHMKQQSAEKYDIRERHTDTEVHETEGKKIT